MALANYSDLIAAVGKWLKRADLVDDIPDMVVLAESEFRRRLRVQDMEKKATSPAAAAVALPDGFKGALSVKIGDIELEQRTLEQIEAEKAYNGVTRYYAIADGQFHFRPVPATGTVTITYRLDIPALTSLTPTNWLMTQWPDLYLFGVIAQAEFYTWNDDRLPLVVSRVDSIIEQIIEDERATRYGAKPPRMKSGVVPTLRRAVMA